MKKYIDVATPEEFKLVQARARAHKSAGAEKMQTAVSGSILAMFKKVSDDMDSSPPSRLGTSRLGIGLNKSKSVFTGIKVNSL